MLGCAALAAAVGLAVLAACGGEDEIAPSPGTADDAGPLSRGEDAATGVDAGPRPTRLEACRAYIQAYCDRSQECGRPTPRCADVEAYCPDYVFAEGSTRTVESVVACTKVRRAMSCGDVLAGRTPDCAEPGTLDAGAPCRFVTQCGSFRCTSSTGSCGTCATPTKDGTCTQACVGSQCVACDVNSECRAGSCAPRTATADAGIVCTFGDAGGPECGFPATTTLKAIGEPCTAKADCAAAADCNADHVCALGSCQ